MLVSVAANINCVEILEAPARFLEHGWGLTMWRNAVLTSQGIGEFILKLNMPRTPRTRFPKYHTGQPWRSTNRKRTGGPCSALHKDIDQHAR